MNTAVPTVSVIIPTYNRADLITQAIDSVLQQTYPDFELIVVDDGSTDDTESVVRAYGDRVRYVRTQNGGTGHARNVGMQHASGRYLTFLDSDDLLYPYALEIETRLLERFPDVSMVCAEVTGFDDHGLRRALSPEALSRLDLSGCRPSLTTRSSRRACRWPTPAPCRTRCCARTRASAGPPRLLRKHLRRLPAEHRALPEHRDAAPATSWRRSARATNRSTVSRSWTTWCACRAHHDVLFADVPTYKLRYHDGQLSTTARSDGRAVWLRKQRVLLRVMKRHILSDQAYYERHRARLDRRLADLHRAVAVPMMLVSAGPARPEAGIVEARGCTWTGAGAMATRSGRSTRPALLRDRPAAGGRRHRRRPDRVAAAFGRAG